MWLKNDDLEVVKGHGSLFPTIIHIDVNLPC